MEILAQFGLLEQKTRWLTPLLEGEIRSALLHDRAGSLHADPTQLQTAPCATVTLT